MKKTIKTGIITMVSVGMIIGTTSFVLAQTSTPSGVPNNAQNRITMIKSRADSEIERRITTINELVTRIQGLKRLADSDKTNLVNLGNGMIANLTSLKGKIDADTDLATLKVDWQSIFGQYRIYMLFMPQLRIYVAADRINDTVDLMNQVFTKLQTRVSDAKSKGKDTAALESELSDAQVKLNDAKTQAQNAINSIKGLVPDGGNNGIQSSNKQALLSAKNMIMTAVTDLQAARKDFVNVRNGLKSFGVK